MEFKTSRLTVRPLNKEDFLGFQTFMKDEVASKYIVFSDEQKTEAGIKEAFELSLLMDEQTMTLALIDQHTQSYIGYIGYAPDFYDSHLQLFWAVNSEYWRQGYAIEALAPLVELLPKPLEAYIHPQNEASLSLARKLNMTYVGECELFIKNFVVLNYRLG